jgi:hypothetical protein
MRRMVYVGPDPFTPPAGEPIRQTDSMTCPTDRVIEISRYKGCRIYGVGRFRAQVIRCPIGSGWLWKAWDTIQPSLGGKGELGKGKAKTCDAAMESCLDLIRREAGIEHVVSGDA